MKDELWMNTETGELVEATKIIRDFYKAHGALEDWTIGWIFSGLYSDETISAPNFAAAVNL